MDKQKSIETLQFFVTGLSEGAFVHKLQGQMFKSQGFTKLGEKYMDHFSEEMGWVEKFVDRILDLGGEMLKAIKHAYDHTVPCCSSRTKSISWHLARLTQLVRLPRIQRLRFVRSKA